MIFLLCELSALCSLRLMFLFSLLLLVPYSLQKLIDAYLSEQNGIEQNKYRSAIHRIQY